MSDEIVFYTNPRSRGAIVAWMLEEVGARYRTEVIDFGPPMKRAEYMALNPMGKVPTIVHAGTVVTECAAICAYLADAFPEAGLAPPTTARGAYYRWLFFGAGPLEHAVTNQALNVAVNEEQQGFVGYGGGLAAVLDTLESALTGRYLAGDAFSAADVYVGSQLNWGMLFGTIEARPAFRRYWDGLKDRPALVRTQAGMEATP